MAKKRARRKAAASRRKGSSKGQKRTPTKKRGGAGARATTRSGAGRKRTVKARRKTGQAATGSRGRGARKARRASPKRAPTTRRAKRPAAPKRAQTSRRATAGREETLSQTPETGRSAKGRTNPMATKRSTGTAAGGGGMRRAPGLERARRQLREVEESVAGPPSSLDLDRSPSAARSGRAEMREARREHNETSPVLTGGDVDASWEDAYAVGDEAPGGDNPTPDQDRVDDIGKALGIEYQDNEELRASDKVADRDKKRWELDPASSEDYRDRD